MEAKEHGIIAMEVLSSECHGTQIVADTSPPVMIAEVEAGGEL
jgi:hypothetical protein